MNEGTIEIYTHNEPILIILLLATLFSIAQLSPIRSYVISLNELIQFGQKFD